MAVDLSVKRVPDDVARKLRRRAEVNHRSLQGELMAILQDAVNPAASGSGAAVASREPVPAAAARTTRRRVAPASESALIIRQAREGRTFGVVDLHRYVSSLGSATPDESTRWIRQGRSAR
jgi:antitoxin FitA